MQREGVRSEELTAFQEEVFAADSYDKALQIMMKWVTVE